MKIKMINAINAYDIDNNAFIETLKCFVESKEYRFEFKAYKAYLKECY